MTDLLEVGVDVEQLPVLQDALLVDLDLAAQARGAAVQQLQAEGAVQVVLVAAPDVSERDLLHTHSAATPDVTFQPRQLPLPFYCRYSTTSVKPTLNWLVPKSTECYRDVKLILYRRKLD